MSYTDIILAALEVNDTATLLKIANELDTMDGALAAECCEFSPYYSQSVADDVARAQSICNGPLVTNAIIASLLG